MKFSTAQIVIVMCFLLLPAIGQTTSNREVTASASSAEASLLTQAEVAKILPATVFFRGQSAPVQTRNSGGIRFKDNGLMLVALVDASGYSSQIQEKYQAYLITESAIKIDGHELRPGAYGCGFVSDSGFVVMDIGGHDLFTAHAAHDADMHRPIPLQVMATPDKPDSYRIYAGRNYVTFQITSAN
jgi:hypothetical protein